MTMGKLKQQGSVLIIVLVMLTIMAIVALALALNASHHSIMTNNLLMKKFSYQSAVSGTEFLKATFNKDSAVMNDVRKTLCTKPYAEQYTGDIGVSEDSRGTDFAWYACVPTDKDSNPAVAKDCKMGGCFAVIVTGVACPKGVKITGTNHEGCSVTRHLVNFAASIPDAEGEEPDDPGPVTEGQEATIE